MAEAGVPSSHTDAEADPMDAALSDSGASVYGQDSEAGAGDGGFVGPGDGAVAEDGGSVDDAGADVVASLPFCDAFDAPPRGPWRVLNLEGMAHHTLEEGAGAIEALAPAPPAQGFIQLEVDPPQPGAFTVRARFKIHPGHSVRDYDILQVTEAGLGSAGVAVRLVGQRFALRSLPDGMVVGASIFYTHNVWFDLVLEISAHQATLQIDDEPEVVIPLESPAELLRTLGLGLMSVHPEQFGARLFVDDVAVGNPADCP